MCISQSYRCSLLIEQVSRGSILEPLPFNLYNNNLYDEYLNGTLQLYADETLFLYQAKNLIDLQTAMQNDLTLIIQPLASKYLRLNISITTDIIF